MIREHERAARDGTSGPATTFRSSQDSNQDPSFNDAQSPGQTSAEQAKQQASATADEAKQYASEMSESAKQKAYEAAQQAKQSGRQYADEKKTQLADEIGVFSGAIRKASHKLHDEQHDSIASYVDAAAEQLDQVRDALQRKDVNELLHDAQDFARRRPELVYGGLFVAGMAAMRFLKASSASAQTERSQKLNRDLSDHSQRTPAAFGHAPDQQVPRPVGYRTADAFTTVKPVPTEQTAAADASVSSCTTMPEATKEALSKEGHA